MANEKTTDPDWYLFRGTRTSPKPGSEPTIPDPPPWRTFSGIPLPRTITWDQGKDRQRAATYVAGDKEKAMVNAAIRLRRPLLISGKPGVGKSSLAFAVAYELGLGTPLYWSVSSKSTVRDSLYKYDAVGRLQENDPDKEVGDYITLGPLGTALLPSLRPRVLLVDEIDKGDDDLTNDLLNVLEEGGFDIPELKGARTSRGFEVKTFDTNEKVLTQSGKVECLEFPLIFFTSNADREFSAPFLRRCLLLKIDEPDPDRLAAIIRARLKDIPETQWTTLIQSFIERRKKTTLATDQLLNAVFLLNGIPAYKKAPSENDNPESAKEQNALLEAIWHALEATG
jgi:MoxR-like ATPase